MKSPVTSISKAALRGRLRDSATPGAEPNSPTLTPLTAKRASRLAIARSHIATSWQPAAVARPLHACDHRRRQALDREHHGRALREQALVVLE